MSYEMTPSANPPLVTTNKLTFKFSTYDENFPLHTPQINVYLAVYGVDRYFEAGYFDSSARITINIKQQLPCDPMLCEKFPLTGWPGDTTKYMKGLSKKAGDVLPKQMVLDVSGTWGRTFFGNFRDYYSEMCSGYTGPRGYLMTNTIGRDKRRKFLSTD